MTEKINNLFQVAISKTDHNPVIQIILAEDHQIDEIHKSNQKKDIADQIKTIIFNQTLKKSNYSNYKKNRSNLKSLNKYYSNDRS